MGKEIERKFLVTGDQWKAQGTPCLLRQGYLNSDPERTVRVRAAGGRGFLTVKGKNRGIAREEFEYEIPLEDASAMLERLAVRPLVEKVRWKVPFAGRVWEVDEFLGESAGLVLAEAELPDENAVLELPEWAGEEVSDDPRYFNSWLAAHPWRTWGKKQG